MKTIHYLITVQFSLPGVQSFLDATMGRGETSLSWKLILEKKETQEKEKITLDNCIGQPEKWN